MGFAVPGATAAFPSAGPIGACDPALGNRHCFPWVSQATLWGLVGIRGPYLMLLRSVLRTEC